jgi:hypothetical protein
LISISRIAGAFSLIKLFQLILLNFVDSALFIMDTKNVLYLLEMNEKKI